MSVASTCFQPATQTHPKRSTNASELCTSFFLNKSGKHFHFNVRLYDYLHLPTVPYRAGVYGKKVVKRNREKTCPTFSYNLLQ